MVHQVDACLDEARRGRRRVKVVIVKGSGNGFCAGHAIGPGRLSRIRGVGQAKSASNFSGSREAVPVADATAVASSRSR